MIKNAAAVFIICLMLISNFVFAQGFLKTNKKKIVNAAGQSILLKGINLGNWLIQEGYMMQTSSFANTETELRNRIQSLIGVDNTIAFYKYWNETYITKKDIDQIAAWGFNSIRLPMHYAKLITKDQPGVYLEEGFATIDSALSWCEQNKIYLILDLHAAPGSQNGANISDCTDGVARLWTDVKNQDRTVELWGKLAQRYADREWIGGYDLINETVYNFPSGNGPLWNLMERITNEIRKSDTNHIIFIEGNQWANDFNNLPSVLWDKNLVFSFHKYWNQTDIGTINYLLTLSSKYNIPLWLGETGENSNGWFTEVIELMESNNIGYCFWPYKKIQSISGLVTTPVTPDYQILLNFWKSGGTKPAAEYAKNALMNMANKLAYENCQINKDVIDAMFRQVNNNATIPYAENKIPGVIYCVDYDMGKPGFAYNDKIYKNTNMSDDYNNGWIYRNDGVDIERCSDDPFLSNGYNVGWVETGDWLNYTITNEQYAHFDVTFRVSGNTAGGKIVMRINGQTAGVITVPATGGWQSWKQIAGPMAIPLSAGQHVMQLQFLTVGFNISAVEFSINTTDVYEAVEVKEFSLHQNYPNPFNPTTTISYELPEYSKVSLKVFDMLGKEVSELVDKDQPAGKYTLSFNAQNLPSGIYIYKIQAGTYTQTRKLTLIK